MTTISTNEEEDDQEVRFSDYIGSFHALLDTIIGNEWTIVEQLYEWNHAMEEWGK